MQELDHDPDPAGQRFDAALAADRASNGVQSIASPRSATGIEKATFTQDAATQNLSGKFTVYFASGTVTGKFKFVPAEGSLVGFAAANYTGSVKIVSGTGTLSGAKGVGMATCTSPDGLHFNCVYQLALTAPLD